MGKILEAAKTYRSKGFSVFPVKFGAKTPAIEWKPFMEKAPTMTELEGLFSNDRYNIGIVTGPISRLVVVDIDDPRKYAGFIKQYPTERVAQTPSGGYHLYYRYAGEDIKSSVSKIDKKIDIRATGGYVVAAPSAIELPDAGMGFYNWCIHGEPSPLPDLLRKQLVSEPEIISTSDDAKNMVTRVLVNGFTPGAHNQEVKDIGRYLYRQGMNEQAIIDILTPLNMKDPTPLAQTELERTIRSGVGYERKRLDKAAKDSTPTEFDAYHLIDAISAFSETKPTWLIEGWLPENSLMMVSAPPEHNKTWLGLDAAVSVALGSDAAPFLGRFPVVGEGKPVLIIQQEDYIGSVLERIRLIMLSKGKDISYPIATAEDEDTGKEILILHSIWNAPIYLHTSSQLAIDDEDSLRGLENQIKEKGIKLVFIDPLYMLAPSDNFFADMAREMRKFKEMRRKYGVTFLFAHHNVKTNKDNKIADISDLGKASRFRIYGSQLLNGAFEGFWILDTVKGRLAIGRTGKSFVGSQQPYYINFAIDGADSDPYTVTIETPEIKPDAVISAEQRPIYQAIRELGGRIAATQLKNLMVPINYSKTTFYKHIKVLIDNGYIVREGNDYFLPDTGDEITEGA